MDIQPTKPIIVVDLFPELLDELINLLRGFTQEEWDLPTICAPWSVKDVCLHLWGVEIANLSWKRDGLFAFPMVESYDRLVEWINKQNNRWVMSTQHISSKLLVDLLKFTGEQVIEYFQTIDPYDSGVPVDWVGPGPAPNWLDMAREYTERWHHQQHIRDAVGTPGLKGSRFLDPILDTFILALPRTFDRVVAEEGVAICISTSGSTIKNWALIYQSGQWRLYEGVVDQPQASITIPDDTAWRVFTKGISFEDARKQAQISGNQKLALKVLEAISIIA